MQSDAGNAGKRRNLAEAGIAELGGGGPNVGVHSAPGGQEYDLLIGETRAGS